MTQTEAKRLIPYVKESFIAAFPVSREIVENTPFVLVSNRNRAEIRIKTIEDCGAEFKEDGNIRGEVIFGTKGYAILIYLTVAKTEKEFCYTAWHELGHIFTRIANKEVFDMGHQDLKEDRDTKLRSGLALWAEYIAEYIAILIDDAPPMSIAWPKQDVLTQYIKEATLTDGLHPYPLAFYCAIMMGDNTVAAMLERTPNADIGLDACDELLTQMILDLLRLLDKELCKEDYWLITKEILEDIGAQIDDLWTHCAYLYQMKQLRKRFRGK